MRKMDANRKDMLTRNPGGVRLGGLDLLRVVSALMIFLFHSSIHIKCNYGLLNPFIKMGACFMTGFFMLSGFIMFYVYAETDITELRHIVGFYKKRVVHILPTYYVVAVLFNIFIGQESISRNLLLAPVEALGIQSMFSSLFSISHNGGTWFVSCIIFCYLLFPFLQNCVKQMERKFKAILLIVCEGILLYAPIVVLLWKLASIYTNPFFRILEFLAGILLASLVTEMEKSKILKLIFLNKGAIAIEFSAMIISITFLYEKNIFRDNYMMYSWICMPIFSAMLVALKWEKVEESKVVHYFSNLSYCFFLSQFFVWKIINRLQIESNVLKMCFSLLVCIIISIVLHEWVEKPCGKLLMKKRIAI